MTWLFYYLNTILLLFECNPLLLLRHCYEAIFDRMNVNYFPNENKNKTILLMCSWGSIRLYKWTGLMGIGTASRQESHIFATRAR